MSSKYSALGRAWDDRMFKAAARATDKPIQAALALVAGLVLAVGVIVFAGWQIGWWFTGQNVNRESHVLRNSYANQQTLRDQITQNIGNVLALGPDIAATAGSERQALQAQRVAIVNIVCGDAAQVTGDPLSNEQGSFIKTNCEAGTIRPGSPYAVR